MRGDGQKSELLLEFVASYADLGPCFHRRGVIDRPCSYVVCFFPPRDCHARWCVEVYGISSVIFCRLYFTRIRLGVAFCFQATLYAHPIPSHRCDKRLCVLLWCGVGCFWTVGTLTRRLITKTNRHRRSLL